MRVCTLKRQHVAQEEQRSTARGAPEDLDTGWADSGRRVAKEDSAGMVREQSPGRTSGGQGRAPWPSSPCMPVTPACPLQTLGFEDFCSCIPNTSVYAQLFTT